jgi:hypothetical protein
VCDFAETLNEDCVNKPDHILFFFNEGGGLPSSCTYLIDYPIQVNYNGNVINIPSFSDYTALLNSDPNVYSGLSLVYPVSANKFDNGQQLTFTADGEICQYLNFCF